MYFPKGACIAPSPIFTKPLIVSDATACPQAPDWGDKVYILRPQLGYKGPALCVCASITSCMVPTNTSTLMLSTYLQLLDLPSLCYAHRLVSRWRASLPLLKLSSRTQDKGHFLLEVFPNLSLGWIRFPSSEPHHISVCTGLSYKVMPNLSAPKQMVFYTEWAQDSTSFSSLGHISGLKPFPSLLTSQPPR